MIAISGELRRAYVSLMPNGYCPRLIDPVIEAHMRAFGAVEIMGTMWCGKTWTSLAHANSVARLGDSAVREMAEISLDTALDGETPRVIDEWQEQPRIWDAIRTRVDDAGGKRGLYLLTGSSKPAKGEVHHTGSGRISRLRMWPMSLSETGDSIARISLGGLFSGTFVAHENPVDLKRLAVLACRGGWPGALELDSTTAKIVPQQYIDTLVSSEDDAAIAGQGDLHRFLRSIARNVGSAATIDTLAKDIGYTVDGKVRDSGRNRIKGLIEYFKDRFVIDSMGGWDAPVKSPQRLRIKPKYDFADPSLTAALLGVNAEGLMANAQIFGQVFEQLCLRDLKVYASCMQEADLDSLCYYRDADGLEVDAVLQLRDGRWGAVEVKLGANKIAKAEKSLLSLARKIAANPAAQNPRPSFLMILVGKIDRAFVLPSGVHVVPITSLTA